jgi:hypothetical protein
VGVSFISLPLVGLQCDVAIIPGFPTFPTDISPSNPLLDTEFDDKIKPGTKTLMADSFIPFIPMFAQARNSDHRRKS